MNIRTIEFFTVFILQCWLTFCTVRSCINYLVCKLAKYFCMPYIFPVPSTLFSSSCCSDLVATSFDGVHGNLVPLSFLLHSPATDAAVLNWKHYLCKNKVIIITRRFRGNADVNFCLSLFL